MNKQAIEETVTPSMVAAALLTMAISGCSPGIPEFSRDISTAFEGYLDTSLGQLFEASAEQHPGDSGFTIIRRGREAFTARIALTELAEKSLDVQYYIWEQDATGRILAEHLVRAADRGVRVRVLIDDINLAGRDPIVAALDGHPLIEIQIFNPFKHRDSRLIDFAIDLGRVNHRMHNKIMVADNSVAIVGGRNIGDHYFEVAMDANFRDLDIAAAGPVVRDISRVFDHFWNGNWAVPISALVEHSATLAELEERVEFIRSNIAEGGYPHPLEQDVRALESELTSIRDQFVWAPGQIVWDDPVALAQGIAPGAIISSLRLKLEIIESELLIESAYFVMTDTGIDVLKGLNDKGIRVRVMTNSLASNDVIAAHAGHAKHRSDLIENGVELYEMRPDAGTILNESITGELKSALHTKAIVFDRESVFIGSFNLDPRSASINTEAGLYVESPELAELVIAYMDEGVLPKNSYRVSLEDGNLTWITENDGEQVQFDEDPDSNFIDRMIAGFIMMLPVEQQL